MVRRLLVSSGTFALLLLMHADAAWAGPPPPPSGFGGGGGDRAGRLSAPPPPEGRLEAEPTAPSDPLSIDARTPDTDLTTNWTYSTGGITGPNYIRDADDDPFFTVNPIGYYQGVSSSGGNLPPFAPKEVGGEAAVLTWTGFERTESSSRVFIQLSAVVTPEISTESGRVFVKLPSTSVKVRNNSRKLITKFFKTPVNEVKITRSGKDVLVVLELRWETEPNWSFEPGANGYQVLVLEFPDEDGGSGDPDSTPMDPTPPPPDAPPAPTPPPTLDQDESSDDEGSDAFLPT